MKKIGILSLTLSGTLFVSGLAPAGHLFAQVNEVENFGSQEQNQANVIMNEDGTLATLERVSESKIIVHEGDKETVVHSDKAGNVYVDGVLSGQVTFEENLPSGVQKGQSQNSIQQSETYNWVYGGQRKYSMDFVDKSRATAAAMLAVIPGWGVYAAAAATIANIWTSGKQLWFIEDTQVTNTGIWMRTKTRTYSDANYTNMIKDSGWSSPIRIHW